VRHSCARPLREFFLRCNPISKFRQDYRDFGKPPVNRRTRNDSEREFVRAQRSASSRSLIAKRFSSPALHPPPPLQCFARDVRAIRGCNRCRCRAFRESRPTSRRDPEVATGRDRSPFREIARYRVDLTQINLICCFHGGNRRTGADGERGESHKGGREPQGEAENFVENRNSERGSGDTRGILLTAVAKFSSSHARGRHYHKCLIHERRRIRETPARLPARRTRVIRFAPRRTVCGYFQREVRG